MPQPKDKDWLNGYKNKTPIYAVYKRPTSKQEAQTKSEGLEKNISCKWNQKKAGVAILNLRKMLMSMKEEINSNTIVV